MTDNKGNRPRNPAKKTPEVGTKHGPAPLPTGIRVPDFIQLDREEIHALLNVCRDPLCAHIFFLVLSQSTFKDGNQITNYARLIALCSPPAPERGKRLKPPSKEQVRRALRWLEDARLIKRDAVKNEAQGHLRIHVYPRDKLVRHERKKTG